jgi:D-glycero-D-manno-heptose 1,7-bisphosphate phosphatase
MADEAGYLNHISRFRMFPYTASAIRRLNDAGLTVVVVTNQSGVARGYFPETLVNEVHSLMKQQLAQEGAHLTAIYYCAHGAEDACECRKPKPGLLERAAREHQLDLSRSFVIGDRYVDMELARRVGARGVMVRTGYGAGELQWHMGEWPTPPDFVADDLAAAVDWILKKAK